MASFASQISFVLLFLLFATTFNRSIVTSNRMIRCNKNDQRLLLIFKQGVVDPDNQLSSWTVEVDCCSWEGVYCDDIAGRVTELSLFNLTLRGEINLCVLQLEFLSHLDLSYNHFDTVNLPPCQISKSPFHAHKFHNQSLATPHSNQPSSFSVSLHYLNFSYNGLVIDDLHWLSQLSSLKYLDLNHNDIETETKWLHYIAMLPSLSELHLRDCRLRDFPSLDCINFTSLEVLDLSHNFYNMKPKLPNSLFNITNRIYHLDLSYCHFNGQLPKSLLNLQNLKYLDLGGNNIKGSIPNWLGQYERLQYLDLSHNQLSGNLPETLGELRNLNHLGIGRNPSVGVPSEKIFSKFSNLTYLDLRSISFKFGIDPKWVPPFQLETLYIGNSSIGPNVPTWIYTQRSLKLLGISTSGISKIDAHVFWSFVAGLDRIHLSNNLISDDISNVTLSANISYFDASNNSLSGSISSLLCQLESNGESKLVYLDLSYNHLSGGLPDCWANWKQLEFLDLRSNKLYGRIPLSLALLTNLVKLSLGDNGFFGNFSLDLSHWTNLEHLELDRNKFSGGLPNTMQQNLTVFIVRTNQFTGNIPTQLCHMSSLRVIDFADNKLSGSIPQCLYNIVQSYPETYLLGETSLVSKGRELDYHNIWFSVYSIDFSCNNLTGEIPKKLFNLTYLWSLNLSRNHLIGNIPKEIGDLKYLESLDLSYNRLDGEIPSSISTISFLAYLNLSYNNFIGQIPIGTQIQTFNSWSFVGNLQLCGDPLPMKCNKIEDTHNSNLVEGNEDNSFMKSLYLGMGVGFAVGFWGVCGSLFLIRIWRHRFFRSFYCLVDRLYVCMAIKLRSFHRIFGIN